MRRLLLLALLALSCVLVSQSPAVACDEAPESLARELRAADLVFAGTITEVAGEPGRRGARVTYSVATTRSWRGDVQETMSVSAPPTVAACGIPSAKVGDQWLFLATPDAPGTAVTRSSDGTRPIDDRVRRIVVDRLGPGTVFGAPPAEPAYTELSDEDATEFWPLALPGVVLVGAGLAVVAAARALGRRRDA